jgi:SpoVK/Ycf46/Vps4 family AAA+-type ATPase
MQIQHQEITGPLEELNCMVGLQAVKPEINALIQSLRVEFVPDDKMSPISLHIMFAGRHGVGKSRVAHLYGLILRDLGVLKKGHLIEAGVGDLVAGYIGQSAHKTKEQIQSALDGVLLIDAYPIFGRSGEIGNSFASEAVDTLLKEMDNYRGRIAVILEAYPKYIEQIIAKNLTVRSRFPKVITFGNYDSDQLLAITHSIARSDGLRIDPAADERMKSYFAETTLARELNGRLAWSLLRSAREVQAARTPPRLKNEPPIFRRFWRRIAGGTEPSIEVQELTADDFDAAIAQHRSLDG